MKCALSLLLLILTNPLAGQMTWWNPKNETIGVVEGQAWPSEVESFYDRLPGRAKSTVAEDVWNLSHHSAGLMIRFRTNASEIKVRYGTKRRGKDHPYAMVHMPATGVSGVDLFAITSDGQERWVAGQRSMGDTVNYRFLNLIPNDGYHKKGREYRLYLPLYNQVEWLEVGVGKEALFTALPVRAELPIVVYGTSIAQGACASRPGMAWTAQLSRKLDRPLINLGFSGNGRLEKPLIDLMSEIEAKAYVLDCLPNMVLSAWPRCEIQDEAAFRARTQDAVKGLRARRPDTPILLVDHAGYTSNLVNQEVSSGYLKVNELQQGVYQELLSEGMQNLHYLTREEIGLRLDDLVDVVHPSDLGMQRYAIAYERKLREILREPTGLASTTHPIIQSREMSNYNWENRHRQLLDMGEQDPPKTVFIANSIVHFWGGEPVAPIVREGGSWEDWLTPMGVRNYAYGWDRIENVLWRAYHGELDGFAAERVLVMIGTNNLHLNTNEEILEGLNLLMLAIKDRQPTADIYLLGLLPRRNYEARIQKLNFGIAGLAATHALNFADLGGGFLGEDRSLNEAFFSDGLHPNEAGYLQLRKALKKVLHE